MRLDQEMKNEISIAITNIIEERLQKVMKEEIDNRIRAEVRTQLANKLREMGRIE